MHVQVLETVSYDAQGRSRRCEKVVRPSWEQIEAAIRQLDRKHHPYLFLWPSEGSATHMLDEFCERMEIMGGDGLYWLAGTFGGYFQRRFLNPAGKDAEVPFWGFQIEHGFGTSDRHVCRDLELVVRAARYYAERGEFHPSVSWEEKPRRTGIWSRKSRGRTPDGD